MMQQLRIKLARWILGKHCPCYQMGYHTMVNTEQWVKEKKDERRKHTSRTGN
jgi:hypothetical protein